MNNPIFDYFLESNNFIQKSIETTLRKDHLKEQYDEGLISLVEYQRGLAKVRQSEKVYMQTENGKELVDKEKNTTAPF